MSRFGSLYYTDCVPGQGLQGSAGFQFQAATPGTAVEGMDPVQRAALYEPPTSWMREQRPVESYPRSLAHVSGDGLFATAAGRYLGREANGSREGNQFTHAVVTRDAAAYDVLRPAQLWAAPWWVERPVDGTELPELGGEDEPLMPGPLDTETVRERLRDADGGRETLVALVSALHHLSDPDARRKVVLLTEDPERAACWLAGATLLLPRAAALAVNFKIYVADPQRGRHDVIAVHPEWAGRWGSTERGSGLAVFDLDVGRHSEVDPTEAARFWAPRFLDEDPYDITDAVELAGRFTGGSPAAGESDRLVALVVVGGRTLSGPAEAEQAAAWLRATPPAIGELVREPVVDAVLAAGPSPTALRALVTASETGGWEKVAGTLRGGLLAAELAEVTATDGLRALRELHRYEPLDAGTATPGTGVADILDAARSGRADLVPALCTLAARHGLELPPGRFDDATLARFGRWWVGRTEPELRHRAWPEPPGALAHVRDALRAMLRGSPADVAAASTAIHDRWGDVFGTGGGDLADPLDVALAGYAFRRSGGTDRQRVLAAVLDAAARDPAGAGERVWNTLFGPEVPPVRDVRVLLDGLRVRGLPLSAGVARGALRSVDRDGVPSADVLAVVEDLRGGPLRLTGYALRVHEDRNRIHRLAKGLTADTPARPVEAMVRELVEVPAEIVRVHAADLAEALTRAPVRHAVMLVNGCDRERMRYVYTELTRRLPREDRRPDRAQCRAAALLYAFTDVPGRSKEQKADYRILRGHLADALRGLGREDLERIDHSYDPNPLGDGWWEWVRANQPGKVRGLFGRARPGGPKRKEG